LTITQDINGDLKENQEMVSPAMKKIIRKPNLPQKVAEMFSSYQTTDKSNR